MPGGSQFLGKSPLEPSHTEHAMCVFSVLLNCSLMQGNKTFLNRPIDLKRISGKCVFDAGLGNADTGTQGTQLKGQSLTTERGTCSRRQHRSQAQSKHSSDITWPGHYSTGTPHGDFSSKGRNTGVRRGSDWEFSNSVEDPAHHPQNPTKPQGGGRQRHLLGG